TPAPLPDYVNSWADDFADTLETKVSVQMGKKHGRIVVELGGQEDFDRILEILGGGEQYFLLLGQHHLLATRLQHPADSGACSGHPWLSWALTPVRIARVSGVGAAGPYLVL